MQAIKVNPNYDVGVQQPRPGLAQQGRCRRADRRLRRRPSRSTRTTTSPTTTAACCSAPRATSSSAIADFDAAIKLNPSDAQSFYNRGSALAEKREYDRAITDFDAAIKLDAELCRGVQRTRLQLISRRTGRTAPRGLRPGDQAQPELRSRLQQPRHGASARVAKSTAPSPTSMRRSSSTRISRWPTTTAATPTPTSATTTAPSPTSARPSSSSRTSARPTTTAASPMAPRATTTGRSSDFDQVLRLEPENAVAFNNRGIAYRNKGAHDRAIADFDAGDQAQRELCRRLLQPRHRLLRQARPRPRDRRLRRRRSSSTRPMRSRCMTAASRTTTSTTTTARSPTSMQLVQDRVELRGRGAAEGEGARPPARLRPSGRCDGGQPIKLNPSFRAGVQRSRRRVSPPRASSTAPSPTTTRRSRSTRLTASPSTIAATPSTASGSSTRRWRTSTRRSSSIRRTRSRTTIAALTYYDQREYDRAVADFDQAIRLDPKDAFAYYNRGIAQYGRLDFDRAIADFDQAIKLDAKIALAYPQPRQRAMRASATTTAPSPISTRRSSSTATTPSPSTTAAWPMAPRAISTARSGISTARSRSTQVRAGLHQPRRRLWREGRDRPAIADFDQAIKLNPTLRVRVLQPRQRLLRQAATTTARSRTTTRRSSSIRTTRWPTTTAAMPTATSATSTAPSPTRTQAIKLQPDYALAFNDRGLAYGAKGEIERAIADFDQAIKLNPKNALAFYNRGLTLREPRRDRPRHRRLRQAIQLNAELHRGALRARQRPPDQARLRPRHRRSRPGDPAQPELRRGLLRPRRGLRRQGRRRTAPLPTSTQAIKLDPKDALAFNNRGFAYRNKGDVATRHRGLRPGDQARAGLRARLYNRGNAYYEKRDFDRAIADFDQAIKLQPELRSRLLQSRPGVPRQGRLRPRHRRLQPGDPARSEERARLQQPRPRAPQQGRRRSRHCRLRAGDQARSEARHGVQQPRRRARP